MGREFDQLFDEWAATYDETVIGNDEEYKEVFLHYDTILDEVAKRAKGTVVEFGVGTGNLSQKLLNHHHHFIGVEPSKEMRTIAKQKIPSIQIVDGDFLLFPQFNTPIHSIVSSYAFHHLTDDEKNRAIGLYSQLLQTGDKIIFADTMFITDEAKKDIIETAKTKGYHRLVEDLQTEYYPTIPVMQQIFQNHPFDVTFTKMNSYVWVLEAVKTSQYS